MARRNRSHKSPSPSDSTSSISSAELTPPPDTPTTPAIVKRARVASGGTAGSGGGAGERLQAVMADDGITLKDDVAEPSVALASAPTSGTPRTPGKARPGSKSTTDHGLPDADDSSTDDDDETEETPLFDDAFPTHDGNAHLKLTINPRQPLLVHLPRAPDAPPTIYTYPPASVPLKYLPDPTQQIKLARFLPCRTPGCTCDGLKPPGYTSGGTLPPSTDPFADADADAEGTEAPRIILWVNPTTADIQGLEKLDPLATEVSAEQLWETCGACGCGWRMGEAVESGTGEGHTVHGVDKDELQRRRRVAHRAEEMFEDVGKLLDFGYMNDDIRGTLKQLEPFQAPHASKSVPSTSTLNGPPKTGKSLKRTLEDRETPDPDPAGVESFPPPPPIAKPPTGDDDDDEDEEDDDEDEEEARKRARVSKTGKRGPAGRVPLKTKADTAAQQGVVPGGQGAGKQMASQSREPVSIVRKIDGDAIVDEQGNVLDKREPGVEDVEADEMVDATMDGVDAGTETPLSATFKTEPEDGGRGTEERELVDNLTKGVTIDMDDQDKLAESLGVDGLDNVDDWADIEFEKLPPKPAMVEYEKGYIKLPVVSSSEPSAVSSIVLVGLKNLFQRQLPKMPREYITRLVLDDKHYSMAIVKRGWRVVGGICYRPFESRNFAEIVFCAVESTEQIRGYGSFMMNQVKDYVRKAHPTITHFLTYADNYAIGYFKKQGFSKEITFPRERWVGYIKDYDSANLMMCKMIPRVKYAEAVLAKIQTISQSHVVRPGLALFKNRRPGETITPAKEDIPGLVESGWDAQMDELLRTSIRPPQYVLFQQILNDLVDDANAWPFLKPVDKTVVKDYYDVIAVPMDLQTMELKLESNHYKDLEEFTRDVKLIVANCKQYNGHSNDNSYTKAANALEKAFNKILVKRTAQATGNVLDKKDKKDKK